MTYNYTDKQLNELNQGKNVYSVNESFSENNDTKTVVSTAAIDPKNETNTLTVGDQEFKVIATKVDPETGFDGMAVAPIVNEKVDTSQVIIAYAGTNAADEHDRDTDIQMVIGGDTSKLSTDTKTVRVGSSTSKFMLYYKGVRNVSSFIA